MSLDVEIRRMERELEGMYKRCGVAGVFVRTSEIMDLCSEIGRSERRGAYGYGHSSSRLYDICGTLMGWINRNVNVGGPWMSASEGWRETDWPGGQSVE